MVLSDEERAQLDQEILDVMYNEALVKLDLLKKAGTWILLEREFDFKNGKFLVSFWARYRHEDEEIAVCKQAAYYQGEKECSKN